MIFLIAEIIKSDIMLEPKLVYIKYVYLRGGYKFNYDEVNYTVGFGLDFKNIVDYKLKLDYLFLDYGDFGSLNQFSLQFNL